MMNLAERYCFPLWGHRRSSDCFWCVHRPSDPGSFDFAHFLLYYPFLVSIHNSNYSITPTSMFRNKGPDHHKEEKQEKKPEESTMEEFKPIHRMSHPCGLDKWYVKWTIKVRVRVVMLRVWAKGECQKNKTGDLSPILVLEQTGSGAAMIAWLFLVTCTYFGMPINNELLPLLHTRTQLS